MLLETSGKELPRGRPTSLARGTGVARQLLAVDSVGGTGNIAAVVEAEAAAAAGVALSLLLAGKPLKEAAGRGACTAEETEAVTEAPTEEGCGFEA